MKAKVVWLLLLAMPVIFTGCASGGGDECDTARSERWEHRERVASLCPDSICHLQGCSSQHCNGECVKNGHPCNDPCCKLPEPKFREVVTTHGTRTMPDVRTTEHWGQTIYVDRTLQRRYVITERELPCSCEVKHPPEQACVTTRVVEDPNAPPPVKKLKVVEVSDEPKK